MRTFGFAGLGTSALENRRFSSAAHLSGGLFPRAVSDPEAFAESGRDRYRRGVLSLVGLHFWVVEPPGTTLAEANADTPWLTADGPISEARSETAKKLAAATPASASGWYLFFSKWNAFAYFAADEICFAWSESRPVGG